MEASFAFEEFQTVWTLCDERSFPRLFALSLLLHTRYDYYYYYYYYYIINSLINIIIIIIITIVVIIIIIILMLTKVPFYR